MRKFRSDRKNLSDIRIAYMILFIIAALSIVMGFAARRAETALRTYELERCRGVLTECADALHAWAQMPTGEEGLSAALRFRSAVTALPTDVERETLLAMADRMRAGDAAITSEAKSLGDTFSLLAALEYANVKEMQIIAETLAKVSAVLLPAKEAVTASADEVTQYSLTVAKRVVQSLFDENAPDLHASDDGSRWVADMQNMRLTFSAFDGSLESFVYIRLGTVPKVRCSEAELVERAVRFAGDSLGLKITDGLAAERMGDFTAVELRGSVCDYRAVLDAHGRVWSMAKVKR